LKKEGFSQPLSNVPLFFKEGDLGGDLVSKRGLGRFSIEEGFGGFRIKEGVGR